VLYNGYIVEWKITTHIYVTCNIVFAELIHLYDIHIQLHTLTKTHSFKFHFVICFYYAFVHKSKIAGWITLLKEYNNIYFST